MYMYIHVHGVCIRVMYVHVHVYMYVCTCACIYIRSLKQVSLHKQGGSASAVQVWLLRFTNEFDVATPSHHQCMYLH